MPRRVAFFLSALLLSGLLAALLSPRPRPAQAPPPPHPAPSSPKSFLGRVWQVFHATAQTGANSTPAITPPSAPPAVLQEVRISALRGLKNYGWVQLPRGTPVDLLATEGDYLVVRYDETVVRIHRCIAEAGLVLPRPMPIARR